jgi:hypothetical protein
MKQWHITGRALILALGILFLLPPVVRADNCGSLYDCWHTASAAGAAAAGAGAVAAIGGAILLSGNGSGSDGGGGGGSGEDNGGVDGGVEH